MMMDLLLGVVRRVSKKPWKHTAGDTITTSNDNSMGVGLHERVVKEEVPYRMYELTLAVRESVCRRALAEKRAVKILNYVRKLENACVRKVSHRQNENSLWGYMLDDDMRMPWVSRGCTLIASQKTNRTARATPCRNLPGASRPTRA